MTPDFTKLEAIEAEAISDLWRAAPSDVRSAYDIEVMRIGDGTG